jgi:hypothetical protein
MITRERIREDIDALGTAGTETVRITKARHQHLCDVERLALLYLEGLLDEAGLRRALTQEFSAHPGCPAEGGRG